MENEVLHQEAKDAIAFIATEMPSTDDRREKNIEDMLRHIIDVIFNSIRGNFLD